MRNIQFKNAEKDKINPNEGVNDQIDIFTQIYMEEAKFKQYEIFPEIFPKKMAFALQQKYDKINSFGHYLLLLVIAMKIAFINSISKHRFVSFFCLKFKKKISKKILKFDSCYNFINKMQYNTTYELIYSKFERLIEPYCTKKGDLNFENFKIFFKKNCTRFSSIVPIKSLSQIFMCSLLLKYNEKENDTEGPKNRSQTDKYFQKINLNLDPDSRQYLIYLIAWTIYKNCYTSEAHLYRKIVTFIEAMVKGKA